MYSVIILDMGSATERWQYNINTSLVLPIIIFANHRNQCIFWLCTDSGLILQSPAFMPFTLFAYQSKYAKNYPEALLTIMAFNILPLVRTQKLNDTDSMNSYVTLRIHISHSDRCRLRVERRDTDVYTRVELICHQRTSGVPAWIMWHRKPAYTTDMIRYIQVTANLHEVKRGNIYHHSVKTEAFIFWPMKLFDVLV